MKHWIKNFDELATSEERKKALQIVEAGLSAVNTKEIVENKIKLEGNNLKINGHEFDLNEFKHIKVIGFGKASGEAAVGLEKILGDKIKDGAVIDIKATKCEFIKIYQGDHPRPSEKNLNAAKNIVEIAGDANENDLVIVIVSGGGSALLCWPEEECVQSTKLYDEFLGSGGTIKEMNIIRRHLSSLKGGGLAKILYPATVVGLVFCDIPGNFYSDVASGPTFKDKTTVEDAKEVLRKYDIVQEFKFIETPKEDKFFEKVINIPMTSNDDALSAMADESRKLGLEPLIISNHIYDFSEVVIKEFFEKIKDNSAILAGGEIRIKISSSGGKGGRNQYLSAKALNKIGDKEVFVSVASDGLDNSDSAGAIADQKTKEKIKELNIDAKDYIDRYDAYNLFEKTGDLIFTGPTGANVADLMLLLRT